MGRQPQPTFQRARWHQSGNFDPFCLQLLHNHITSAVQNLGLIFDSITVGYVDSIGETQPWIVFFCAELSIITGFTPAPDGADTLAYGNHNSRWATLRCVSEGEHKKKSARYYPLAPDTAPIPLHNIPTVERTSTLPPAADPLQEKNRCGGGIGRGAPVDPGKHGHVHTNRVVHTSFSKYFFYQIF